MRPAAAALVGLIAVLSAPYVAAQDMTPRQRLILDLLDSNGDQVIDSAELDAFLRTALPRRAAQAGLDIAADRRALARYVRTLRDSILNASTADGNDSIAAFEIDAMEAASLLPPLAGTMKDLLPAAGPKPGPSRPWTDRLAQWLDIRRSFLDEQQIGKPATLSLTNHARDDETVEAGTARVVAAIDAAAILDGFLEWPIGALYLRPIVGYEAHVQSDAPARDDITHRAGFETDYLRSGTALVQSQRLRATFDYRTDRSYAAAVFGGTAEYTLNATALGIGRYLGHGRTIDFEWRPYLGLTGGHVASAGAVEAYQAMTNYFHQFVRFTGEVRIGSRLLITPETTVWHGEHLDGAGAATFWHGFSSLDARLVLSESGGSERASLAATLTSGRHSPAFQKDKEIGVALAFKF